MSAATPLFSQSLESVQQAFDDWRATRGKRMRTPTSLQQRAVALLETYCASHICTALRINDTALKRWSKPLSPSSSSTSSVPPAGLVELPIQPALPDTLKSPTDPIQSISIELGDAIQLRVHGHITLEHILCAVRQHQRGANV